jgi:transcriptional regulator with XRE-family HTH domain
VESNISLSKEEIRFLRKRLGRKANEFAKELGIEPEHLSRLENGKNPVPEPLDKLIRLIYAVSAGDPELLKTVMVMVKSWLITWTKRTSDLRIVKRVDTGNEWSNAVAA